MSGCHTLATLCHVCPIYKYTEKKREKKEIFRKHQVWGRVTTRAQLVVWDERVTRSQCPPPLEGGPSPETGRSHQGALTYEEGGWETFVFLMILMDLSVVGTQFPLTDVMGLGAFSWQQGWKMKRYKVSHSSVLAFNADLTVWPSATSCPSLDFALHSENQSI